MIGQGHALTLRDSVEELQQSGITHETCVFALALAFRSSAHRQGRLLRDCAGPPKKWQCFMLSQLMLSRPGEVV